MWRALGRGRSPSALIAAIAAMSAGIWLVVGAPLPWRSANDDLRENLPPHDARVVAEGKALYAANCATCHGERGEGREGWRSQNPDSTYPPPPHDSTGHTWHHGDGALYRIIRDGGKIYESPGFKSNMPAWGDRLSSDEIRAVITYLKTLWGPRERTLQAEASESDPFPP